MRIHLRALSVRAGALALVAALSLAASASAAPLPGAIFTTDSACAGVNLNIYGAKDAVYLNGGPAHPGAANLPSGSYYVKVTEPDGTLLGTSVGTANETPFVVSGDVVSCIQLSAVLKRASDGSPGYDSTSNAGGEYKTWVSTDPTFANDSSKTDNFKVREDQTVTPATLRVRKYYDANADGVRDNGEVFLPGWQFHIQDGTSYDRETPVDLLVEPDTYTVTEQKPVQANWLSTDPGPFGFDPLPFKTVAVGAGEDKTLEFGNVCLGAGGGLTLGFWSNKNGQALVGADDLAMLGALNLRNADGSNFDPATAAALSKWLLAANATNMANMLSAQLAAMELNVFNGKVGGGSLVWTGSAFVTVNAVMANANDSLGTDGYTVAAGPARSYQEGLKTTLDRANNNLNFVQPTACAFSF